MSQSEILSQPVSVLAENETEAFLVSAMRSPAGTCPVCDPKLILVLILSEVKYRMGYSEVVNQSLVLGTGSTGTSGASCARSAWDLGAWLCKPGPRRQEETHTAQQSHLALP